MKALVFDGQLKVEEKDPPQRLPGEALIRVAKAGICNTDHEITRGYVPGFQGVLGHEFFGYVEEADDRNLQGKRVSGEINLACGQCEYCAEGLKQHCPNRSVLGITGRDGAFAQYLSLPQKNLIEIPDKIPESSAIFIEPLAASLEILEQITIKPDQKVLLIGDGKLAQLIARVLSITGCRLRVVGRHREKLGLLKELEASTCLVDSFRPEKYPVVIEASGNREGLELGLQCVQPRGILVLKSTFAGGVHFNASEMVVNEVTLVGSRCGRFQKAVEFLIKEKSDLSRLIEREFPLTEALEAFACSERKETLKVVLSMEERI